MSKYIAATVFVLSLLYIGIERREPTHNEEKPDYSHIKAEVTDHDHNVCTLKFDDEMYKIDVRYFENDESNKTLAGQWDSEIQRIILSESHGLDIDTVAHEVSHAVDTIMVIYQPADHHYEAYIQGQLTPCIWQIVQEDVNPPEPEARFRFAN